MTFSHFSGLVWLVVIIVSILGLLIAWFFWRRRRTREFIEYLSVHPIVDHQAFFKAYRSALKLFRHHLPKTPPGPPHFPVDYRKGKSGCTFWPAIPGFLRAARITRIVTKSAKWLGLEKCQKIGDMAAAIFGGEILSQVCARVEVKGVEHLDRVEGSVIFISNHQSYVDFAIVPFVLGVISVGRERPFRPKYMAARDHFYDNWFLYRLLGMGRAMEAVGTIFVDRKAKKDQPTRAVDEAVEAMIQKGSDILMFPQGTRAYGNVDVHGRRLDAGYYTTLREKDAEKELGHLRKGAAYLAIDAAFQLAKEGKKISIVPIGIKGAGVVAPRGKLRFERGATIKVQIGEPAILSKENLAALFTLPLGSGEWERARKDAVLAIHSKIDHMLKKVTGIHDELKRRLIFGMRKAFREEEVGRLMETMEAWEDEEDLIFSIIDVIYSLPHRMWAPLTRRLYQLLIETDTPKGELLDLKKRVVHEMLKLQ